LIGHSKQTTPVATDEIEKDESEEDEDSEVDTGQIMQETREAETEGIPIPDFRNIRADVAGATINFTTWDAALVVYLDCSFDGRYISILPLEGLVSSGISDESRRARVVERTVGDCSVCAAIFPRLPLVNDLLRSLNKVVTKTECKVSEFDEDWHETITLIRGQVNELDWRESLGELALPPSQRERLGRFVGPHGELREFKIMDEGEKKGENTAIAHYPYAVIRDQEEV
jgi:hypothetical protein